MDRITRAARRTREAIQDKSHISGWVLPKQQTSYAPDGTWTNIDLDVTPTERRIWTKLSMLGYWVSDIVCDHLDPRICRMVVLANARM